MKTFRAIVKNGHLELPCYRVGALAVHKRPWEVLDIWYVSHAGTGFSIPGVEMARLRDARYVATRLEASIDWGRLRPAAQHGEIEGLADEMRLAIRDARDEALRSVNSPKDHPHA